MQRMRNPKTLIAVVAFLLLFSSVANAGWWDEITECFSGKEDSEGVGVEKVKETCDGVKATVESATGTAKSKVEDANAATGEIDTLLASYNNICDGLPVDEIETEIENIDQKINTTMGSVATELKDKYDTEVKPKIQAVESKVESYSKDFDTLCQDSLVQGADQIYTAADADMTGVETWVNGLDADAESIISSNGGDDATYQKFKDIHDTIQAVYTAIEGIQGVINQIGTLCAAVMQEIGAALQEIQTALSELDTLCQQLNDFIQNEVITPIENLLGGINLSTYIETELTTLCDDMKASIEAHIASSDWDGFLCNLLQELIGWLDELVDFLDIFMEFWNKLQRYFQCYSCLESQISKLGTMETTFGNQASATCSNTAYNNARAMYTGMFDTSNKEESNNYLFAIYNDPAFEADAEAAAAEAQSYQGDAIAYLEFDPSLVSEAEGCEGDTTSKEAYAWGNQILSEVSNEAGTAKFTLYSVLAQELLKTVGAFGKLLGALASVIGKLGGSIPYVGYASSLVKIVAFASKVLNVFLGVFNALTGTCQNIADSQDTVDALTVPNKVADKLDKQYNGTPYVKLAVMDEEGVTLDQSVSTLGYDQYAILSSPEDMYDRSPESYSQVGLGNSQRLVYFSKPDYIRFIEEWNKQMEYDVTEIIKEMPITATVSPVNIDLSYGSTWDKIWANVPSPICKVEGLFRTENSKGKEDWAPLEMPYKDSEVMWTEIFGISPDIEMRDPNCNILIYNFGSGEVDVYLGLTELLEEDNYEVAYHERTAGDITSTMLANYCQLWFIDSGNVSSITSSEITAIQDYISNGSSVLLTGDSDSFSNIGQIAAGFGLGISGVATEESQYDCDVPLAAACIYPSFIPHEVTNGVTSISQHELSITNSGFKELCTHSNVPCTLFSDSSGGNVIFDSSSERFWDIDDCENSRYARNIARFLSLERWTKTGDIKVYVGGGCTRYHEGTNIEDHHLYCENPLTFVENIWSPKIWFTDYFCSWLADNTVCWKGGNDRGTVGWYHGPIEDWVNVTVVYLDSAGEEQRNSYIKKGKPRMDDEDTINSYFVVDADMPPEARSMTVQAKYFCNTTFNRQVYHVDCDEACLFEKNSLGILNLCWCVPYVGCWYRNGKNVGCKQANTETIIDTSSIADSWSEIDSWMTQDALVRYGSLSTLDVEMSGNIKPGSEDGWEAGMTLKVDPDILSSFSMVIGDYSVIDHQERFYPVKHEMFRRYSTTGTEKKEYNVVDRYGYDSSKHNYPQQCKEVCPIMECECPDSIMEPYCWDPSSSTGYTLRTDCVCVPRDGQEDLCVSDRSFHEDDGLYYDFVRLTAYDMNEMAMMGYAPTKTISAGIVNEAEITKVDGLYELYFTTGTTKDPVTGEIETVTEDDLNNAELTIYTSFESAGTKTMSEWIEDTTTSVPVISLNPPSADFTATPTSGEAPLDVQFTDTSTGSPTSWSWSFGDGGTSTQQSPSHTYTSADTYTVILTAINADGSDTDTGYITVVTAVTTDTCTPACSADPNYEACDATYYAYCRASCNSGEETPPGGLGNDWCQSQEAMDIGVSAPGYVCCCCCAGGMC